MYKFLIEAHGLHPGTQKVSTIIAIYPHQELEAL